MNKYSIIFDLDGTLIDSAPSILASLQTALNVNSVTPIQPLTQSLIGPPLIQIVSCVLGKEQHERIPNIIECFKKYYDADGYKQSVVYPGIQNIIEQLKKIDIDLYIATNKRIGPTKNIIHFLGWSGYFKGIYALDFFQPAVSDKSEMLKCIILELKKDPQNIIYVGDRAEDADAAMENKMSFLWASWGYGEVVVERDVDNILIYPEQIIGHKILNKCCENEH